MRANRLVTPQLLDCLLNGHPLLAELGSALGVGGTEPVRAWPWTTFVLVDAGREISELDDAERQTDREPAVGVTDGTARRSHDLILPWRRRVVTPRRM